MLIHYSSVLMCDTHENAIFTCLDWHVERVISSSHELGPFDSAGVTQGYVTTASLVPHRPTSSASSH
jgi:hypothetical protein